MNAVASYGRTLSIDRETDTSSPEETNKMTWHSLSPYTYSFRQINSNHP